MVWALKKKLIKYSKDIIQKSRINKEYFNKSLEELNKYVKFVDRNEFLEWINKVEDISPDKEDIDFLALAYKENCMLWSNDKILKNQQLIKIISTTDLLQILEK